MDSKFRFVFVTMRACVVLLFLSEFLSRSHPLQEALVLPSVTRLRSVGYVGKAYLDQSIFSLLLS